MDRCLTTTWELKDGHVASRPLDGCDLFAMDLDVSKAGSRGLGEGQDVCDAIAQASDCGDGDEERSGCEWRMEASSSTRSVPLTGSQVQDKGEARCGSQAETEYERRKYT